MSIKPKLININTERLNLKAMSMENPKKVQIQPKASDEELKGRYANMIQVSSNVEEFALDFFLVLPPIGQLSSRIIMSPGHMKRLFRVIGENLKRYESMTGEKVEEAEEPKIGFKADN